jgi:cellulose synthase/poly-beta-1,6-N-acetylglucosamine synthase-like glycosyltransferase
MQVIFTLMSGFGPGAELGKALYFVLHYFFIFYFVTGGVLYAIFNYLGLRLAIVYSRRYTEFNLRNALQSQLYIPISILVPAYNEELTIVASVRSFLSLHHPAFEVIVVSDGSKDRTVAMLEEAYDLSEVPFSLFQSQIPTQPVLRVLRSRQYPNLLVVDKANGGKSDAVNAALNMARYPLVCVVDADSLLDIEALLRASRLFMEDPTVVAVGGTVRPLNGARVQDGQIRALNIPAKWIERLQVLEYNRAFFSGRAGWASLSMLLIISGAFGVFRRQAVLEVGGYATNTVTEDMELVVRLHKYFCQQQRPYRILFTPDPMCWTEVPSDWGTLRRQRNRWHRGLIETLWTHRDMLLNPRYGRIGLLAVPYFWLYEAFSPMIECFGYAFFIFSVATHILNVEFAVWFLALAVLFGMIVSQMSALMEGLLVHRYERLSERFLLLLIGLVEFVGYRQWLVWERFRATFQIRRKRGEWGKMQRKGIASTPPPDSP